MSKKNKGSKGFNKQGIRSLDHIKGPPAGIKLEEPPSSDSSCAHPDDRIIVSSDGLNFQCTKCRKLIGEV